MFEIDIQTGVILWIAAFAAVILFQRAFGLRSVGLVVAYLLALALIHVSGAVLYLDPQYAYQRRDWVQLGFEQSTYGVLAFTLGAGVAWWLVRMQRETNSED